MTLHIPTMMDRQRAITYWHGRPRKIFAVDATCGPPKRPTYAQTWYCRSSTHEAAVACVRREAWNLPRGARLSARLAGPDELGCVAS